MMRNRSWLVAIALLPLVLGSGSAWSKPEVPLWQATTSLQVDELTELTPEAIPVEPGKKLAITFAGRTNGEFTVEEDARIRLVNTNRAGSALLVHFFDETGKRLEELRLPILTASAHEYGREAYPPAGAKSLKLSLSPAPSAEVVVENVRVTQKPEGVEAESVNPHPVFSFGDLNSYGFGGRFFERPDGKTVWNTEFTGQSSPFPVQGGGAYELFARGIGYSGRGSKVFLQLFKAGEKRPFHSVRMGFSPEGITAKVVLPEGVVSANFLGYYVIVEELKITKE